MESRQFDLSPLMDMNKELNVTRYNESHKEEWDSFVQNSKNGTFLFLRDYMDYHKDRFSDNSFIFSRKGKICGLLPANRKADELFSHAGLSYGGLIMSKKTTVEDCLDIFHNIKRLLEEEGIVSFHYKPIPHIYHSIPSEEDLYSLFRFGFKLSSRGVSSTIFNEDKLKFRDIRKHGIKKALKHGINVKETEDYSSFWEILRTNLSQKYSREPVHSLSEIVKLHETFPENIRLFGAFNNNTMVGGVVCYITQHVCHTQYISASPEGKEEGALDLVFDNLINEVFKYKRYFDFGISTEDGGNYLNENLIYQKEGFGGRAICYDSYLLKI